MKPTIRVRTHDGERVISMKTEGLNSYSLAEIEASVESADLVGSAKQFLLYVADYVLDSGRTIRPGETLAYGYWLTKFEALNPDALEVWEYNADATAFVKGVSLTLTYWRDQNAVCRKYQADFRPPRPDQLTVISTGVLEGQPVQGVRYGSPEHMSGWWITTDLYNGDASTLRHEHTHHLTAARPDLARYMALPIGFRYDLANHEDVWFDSTVLAGG
jgi:hypothetical protein